jgi:hypothetical protein
LNEYLASVGGKEAILAAWEEKKADAPKKGKKRARASTTNENGTNGSTKRGKKSNLCFAARQRIESRVQATNWKLGR